jgi:hypothetical protein
VCGGLIGGVVVLLKGSRDVVSVYVPGEDGKLTVDSSFFSAVHISPSRGEQTRFSANPRGSFLLCARWRPSSRLSRIGKDIVEGTRGREGVFWRSQDVITSIALANSGLSFSSASC